MSQPKKDPTLPPGEKVAFIINGVTHYDNGRFEHLPDYGPEGPMKGEYGYSSWVHNYAFGTSRELNKLKAKMFNAIEASGLDERQAAAMKKLLKGFATEAFYDINKEFDRHLGDMGFRDVLDHVAMAGSSDPLEDGLN